MRLERGIFFRQYGGITYLRHVGQRKDYLFDGIAYDVLYYLRENPDCQLQDMCNDLAEDYDLDNREAFDNDIADFVERLNISGILAQPSALHSSDFLREQVRSECIRQNQLFSLTLETTYRCNEHCIHCYVDDEASEEQELTLYEYKSLLDEAWEIGCINVLLTGGEVSMRSDFLDIAEYASSKGFCVDIYTNGLTLQPKQIQRMVKICVNSVSFSLYGPNAKIHDSITQIPGSFERSLRSALLCKCAGLDVFVKTVVMKQNYDALEELLQLGRIAGISINTSMVVTASHRGKPAERFRLMDAGKYQHVTELSVKYDIAEGEAICPEGHDVGLCNAGITGLSIDPYGNVMPCNALHESMGNIRERSLAEIRSLAPLLKELSTLTFQQVCPKNGSCEYARWCAMCIGSTYSEKGKWSPTSDVCLMAEGIYHANLKLAGAEADVSCLGCMKTVQEGGRP